MTERRFFQIVNDPKGRRKDFYTPRYEYREEFPKRVPPVEGVCAKTVDGDRGAAESVVWGATRKWVGL